MPKGKAVTVNSRKYDGRIRRTWQAAMMSFDDPHFVLVGTFSETIEHSDLGIITQGTVSIEHFWLDRWHNIFCFYEPDGSFRNFYCNVTMPPTLTDDVVDFVDLDVDLIVWPDGRHELLDLDDLERNSVKYGYSDEIKARALTEAESLNEAATASQFPFDQMIHPAGWIRST